VAGGLIAAKRTGNQSKQGGSATAEGQGVQIMPVPVFDACPVFSGPVFLCFSTGR